MPFDAAAVRAQLPLLEAKLREAGAAGADDEELLDLSCEANECRDLLRNYESFPAFWAPPGGGPALTAVPTARAARRDCQHVCQLLAPAECAALAAAVLEAPRHAGDVDAGHLEAPLRQGNATTTHSDDPALSDTLWDRLQALLPPDRASSVAHGPEAKLREECWPQMPWHCRARPSSVEPRLLYRRYCDTRGEAEAAAHLDTQNMDDRNEGGRPLLSLLLALQAAEVLFAGRHGGGHQPSSAGRAGQPEEPTAPWTLRLEPGDAAVFPCGDARYAYHVGPAGTLVLHARVLYQLML